MLGTDSADRQRAGAGKHGMRGNEELAISIVEGTTNNPAISNLRHSTVSVEQTSLASLYPKAGTRCLRIGVSLSHHNDMPYASD